MDVLEGCCHGSAFLLSVVCIFVQTLYAIPVACPVRYTISEICGTCVCVCILNHAHDYDLNTLSGLATPVYWHVLACTSYGTVGRFPCH